MIKIDTARSVVNCYIRTTNGDTEIWKTRSDVREFIKRLKLVLNVSIANDILLNNQSMDGFLQKLASSIKLEDVDVLAKLCTIYEGMASIYLEGIADQIRSCLESSISDFVEDIADEVTDSILQAKDEQWAKIKKQLGIIPNGKDVSC